MGAKTILFVGRPCSGKTTTAEHLLEKLKDKGVSVIHLDGDDIRRGLNSDLGFSKEDRSENLRRIGEISELLNNKEIFVIASFICPAKEDRKLLRSIIKNLKIVYVNTPLEECILRDVKGMYKEALEGKREFFTGIDERSPFEEPENADLNLCTVSKTKEENIEEIVILLQ